MKPPFALQGGQAVSILATNYACAVASSRWQALLFAYYCHIAVSVCAHVNCRIAVLQMCACKSVLAQLLQELKGSVT